MSAATEAGSLKLQITNSSTGSTIELSTIRNSPLVEHGIPGRRRRWYEGRESRGGSNVA